MVKPASIFDATNGKIEAKAIAEADADIAAGRFVPHEKVMRWVASWFTPNELPRPESK